MSLLQTPWVRTLLTFTVLFLITLSYCRYHFYRDPGSAFYDEDRAFEREYSAYREREAEKYIEQVSSSSGNHQIAKAGPHPKICATFVSVKRDGKQYLPVSKIRDHIFPDTLVLTSIGSLPYPVRYIR
jgi:hypothetical protein